MNTEIGESLSDLYLEMVLTHQRWHGKSINPQLSERERNRIMLISHRYSYYGGVLDEIRLGIETWDYSRNNQHELGIILSFLQQVNDSELSEKLQSIIDSLGEPVRN